MPLTDTERDDLILETRDIAKATAQSVDQVIVPALKGDGRSDPGLLKRVSDIESSHDQLRGGWKVIVVLCIVISFLVPLIVTVVF